MCSNESPPPAKEPLAVGLGVGNPMAGFLPGLEHYRLQLYHYAMAERLRLAQQLHPQHPGGHPNSGGPGSHLGMSPGFPAPLPLYPAAAAAAAAAGYPSRLALSMALLHPHHQRIPEEPKPQHSYIGLIAMAILSSPDKKLVLSDIYQHILEHYPYFRTRGPGWRNSIRHNLSLNDCFVKSGRSANGKGHYWAIHPANLEDFRRGDFRRRKAQRKVRRHMGLAVDEEPDSPSPPPLPATPPPPTALVPESLDNDAANVGIGKGPTSPSIPRQPCIVSQASRDKTNALSGMQNYGPPVASQPITGIWSPHHHHHGPQQLAQQQNLHQHNHHSHGQHHQIQSQSLRRTSFQPSRKRQFDVASLLAPDDHHQHIDAGDSTIIGRSVKARRFSCSEDEHDLPEPEVDQDEEDVDVDVDVDVVAETNPMPSPGTPSGSPDSKITSSSGHCDWNGSLPGLRVGAVGQPLSAIYLQNHLHVRNYYVQANAGSGSSV